MWYWYTSQIAKMKRKKMPMLIGGLRATHMNGDVNWSSHSKTLFGNVYHSWLVLLYYEAISYLLMCPKEVYVYVYWYTCTGMIYAHMDHL